MKALLWKRKKRQFSPDFSSNIWRTLDGGNTWEEIPVGPTDRLSVVYFFDQDNGFGIVTSNEFADGFLLSNHRWWRILE